MTDSRLYWMIWLLPLLLISTGAVCQKEDANWVFGKGCGIDFNTQPPTTYTSASNNIELSACISDKQGKLLLYLAAMPGTNERACGHVAVYDGNHQIIAGTENLNCDLSAYNGAVIIPAYGDTDRYWIFHIGQYTSNQNCLFGVCNSVYFTVLERLNNNWNVSQKNIRIAPLKTEERLAAVKNANGKDWWIVSHLQRLGNNTPCENGFMVIKLETASQDVTYDILPSGAPHCNEFAHVGAITFTSKGDYFAMSTYGDSILETFSFNRCTGIIDRLDIDFVNAAYSLAFSKDDGRLYVLSGIDIPIYYTATLNAYTIDSTCNLNVRKDTLWSINNYLTYAMSLAPDGKIFLSRSYLDFMATISFPDSSASACGFADSTFRLSANTSNYVGLPNMPNYNLGPLPVYMADAGRDTFYCVGDSTIKAFRIGGDSIYGITYQWQPAPGIDTLNNRTQLVLPPAQSRWYYVTLTDTNYVGPSCNSRLDSVYIEVRNCTGITEATTLQAKLYPNPTTGTLTIELPGGQGGSMALYNLLGQSVYQTTLAGGPNTLALNLPPGLYLYRITSGGKAVNDKLLVE